MDNAATHSRLSFWLILFALFLLPTSSFAQSQRNPCWYPSANPGATSGCIPTSSTNPLPVTATATIGGGFTDATTGTPISVTNAGVTGTLPAGSVIVATNVGSTNGAYCKLGASATTSDQYLSPNGGWFAFSVGANTQLTCITSTSTTTVNLTGGSGLPTGTGGGGSGGGGGGSVTQGTTPWIVAGQGTAGAASSAVQTVQGIAGMTPFLSAQSGTWNVGLTGTLPAYAATPTFNCGTGCFQATQPVSGTVAVTGVSTAANQTTLGNQTTKINDGTNTSSVKAASTAAVATDPALVMQLNPLSPGIITLGPATTASTVPTNINSQYPVNSVTTTPTAVTASTTGTTAATAASLGATASVTNYVCGFDITADATAITTGTAVLSGTISGSLNYLYTITAVTSGTSALTIRYAPCIPASATNTAITITSAAAGTGGNTIVNIFGYKL